MREFTCEFCGKRGVDNSPSQNKRFCNIDCNRRYWTRAGRGGVKGYQPCQYNEGVTCFAPKCESCGWNPAVAKKRKEALV